MKIFEMHILREIKLDLQSAGSSPNLTYTNYVILVSALGPNPSFFLSWGSLIQLGGLLGLGLGLGPGLDNRRETFYLVCTTLQLIFTSSI